MKGGFIINLRIMIQCGVDLVLKSRIEEKIEEPAFLKEVFHPSELKHRGKLASIFVLKEAVMKALGRKVDWLLIEIQYSKNGKPEIILAADVMKGIKGIDGSVSHDGEYIVGFVVVERE